MKNLMENPAGHSSFGASMSWKTVKGLVPKGLDTGWFEKWFVETREIGYGRSVFPLRVRRYRAGYSGCTSQLLLLVPVTSVCYVIFSKAA